MACSITWSYSPARTCVSYKRKQINNISNYQQDWDSRAIYSVLKKIVSNAVGLECLNLVQGQMCIISVIMDFLPILLYCKVWTLNFKNNFTKVEILLMRSFNQFRMTYCLCWDSLQVGMLALDGGKAVLLQKQIKRWKSWSSNDLTIFKLWDEKSFWVFEKCWAYLREISNQVRLVSDSVQGRLDHGLWLRVTSVKFGLQGFL